MNQRACLFLLPLFLLPLCLLACDALFRPLRSNHPENCQVNANLCGSGQVCDPVLERCVTAAASDLSSCPPCPAGQACSAAKGVCEPVVTFDLISISPRTATVGTTPQVALRGIGFEPGMTVTFNGMPASNVTVTAQDQATVQVPAMTQAGLVRVEIGKPGMTVGRDALFGYAWLNINYVADTFLSTDMDSPGSLVVSDLNKDQKLDVAVVHGSRASVFLSLAQASTAGSQFLLGSLSLDGQLASTQLNSEAALDLVYTDRATSRALSIVNNGSGALNVPPQTLNLPGSPLATALADFNEDGLVDLVLTKPSPDQLYVQLGLGGGAFNATANTIIGVGPKACALGTGFFNADMRPDIALLECDGQGVRVYLNMGGGNFSVPLNTATRQGVSAPQHMAITDFNLDGRADIVVLNGATGMAGHLSILPGLGNGSFGNTATVSVPPDYTSVAMADVDGDGLPDAVLGPTSNVTSISLAVLLNDNGTTLRPPQLFAAPATHRTGFHSLAVGDVTGDGKADILYSSATPDVVLLRNQSN